ncbi:FAD-binding oxidoreductase [Dyadobacter sp. CY356]|uniref:NAD(P)/FAD-dependent oxidoreductase n=1 Tax=Dyadobacter sp. CY356 TaxID=2906442 RepID=UPI001F16FAC5|nr:FAD-dependent oxidoreductase [Dyadobacter sp. CY356]MCF0054703.1 FAD-binding oxidoreductase [Dyadobacter sp. CY356]
MTEKSDSSYDYLIVGQGIAGTSLAWHLHNAGKKVLLVNDSSLPSSSKVAAGIFNPLTGKKLVKTWLADDIFPYAQKFYSGLQEKLGAKILHQASIFRPFRSIEEQNSYLSRTSDPGIASYIKDTKHEIIPEHVHTPYGGMEVIQSGWIDLPVLLEGSKVYFLNNNQYLESAFSANDLIFTEEHVIWKNITFDKVILCQGYFAKDNTNFSWLPFTPVKGQILEVEMEKLSVDQIVNQGIFILPVSGTTCRVGATYSWENLNWEVTENARIELEEKLQPLLKVPYEITGQLAGIRPSSHDRRPMLGIHPDQPRLGIFNGLGTKGVTLAPFFAKEFTEYLVHDKELSEAVNIKRYFSLYFR